jgi:hypothetical protein
MIRTFSGYSQSSDLYCSHCYLLGNTSTLYYLKDLMKGLRTKSRKEGQRKLWNPIFSTRRPLWDLPLVLTKESILGLERGTLDYFLQDTRSAIPSWKEDAFQTFLNTGNPSNLQNPARARLDDRSYSTRERRRYEQEWLTPEVLRSLLLAEVSTVKYRFRSH